MREILLTSSVLILALLALRRVFREKISRRVQYALWGLVLVRLLIPVSLPALHFSVLTVAEPVRESITVRLEAPAFAAPEVPPPDLPPQQPQSPDPAAVESVSPGAAPASRPEADPAEWAEAPAAAQPLTLAGVLGIVWLVGAFAMTVWLVASNLRFAAKLRRKREPAEISGYTRRVYMVETGLASPCLFGVLRPAVYLTPAAVRSEESLRHVLAHEETHARHLDPLWSLLRGICLAIYWFNPLVWIAASVSRTDCELACDEGAIRRLGEADRLAYGRTLLTLIPIRRLPGNPLLSATTMSSDKKRLQDRVTRIAENRKTRKLALCAAALLTAGACLITFTGCTEGAVKGDETPSAPADGPLTAAELRYFNEQFFNGEFLNINNQFLSSIYEDPADIDVSALAYCGVPDEYHRDSGKPQADRDTILDRVYGGSEPDCATYEINTATLDALLTDKMGLTLAETNKTGIAYFTYLPEYDAYYWAHGDTNYRPHVDITAGTREGDLLRLYYGEAYNANGWKCVTLRETEGGYQFVSHMSSQKPMIPTTYPAGEPLLTIPLSDLTGVAPQAVELTHHSGDCAEALTYGKNWMVDGRHIQGYRSTDGKIYVAEITGEAADSGGRTVWQADCFAVMPNEEFDIELFGDLFDRSGFAIRYTGDIEGAYQSYYAFDENGTLALLCTVPGYGVDAQIIDLNGDGVNELLCSDHVHDVRLFFQRDGKIYEANVAGLLKEAWPEAGYTEFSSPAPYERCLSLWSFVPAAGDSGAEFQAVAFRNIYFDGEDLLVYKPDKTAVDHVSPGVAGPEDVMTALRQIVQEQMEKRVQDRVLADAGIDGWRIVSLTGPWQERYDGLTVEIYRYNYELHAAAPETVMWSGGLYVDEDGWVSPAYPDCDYIYFRLRTDGGRTYLFHDISNDVGPGSEWSHDQLEDHLLQEGLLEPGPGRQVQAALDRIMGNETVLLELAQPTGQVRSFSVSPDLGNGRSRQGGFGSDSSFSWSAVGREPLDGDPAPNAIELTVASPDESLSLHFFSGSEMVLCRAGDARQWYRAENTTDPSDVFYDSSDVFHYMRLWYDEAELAAARSEIVIPNDGRSREEIAQEWANLYEGAHLRLTSGSAHKWTYLDIRDVDLESWSYMEREDYPEDIGDREAFLFGYSAVFVPEGDARWFMAGSTAEYEGSDAPEGALQWWMCGYMYLMEDGWRCNGAGTGP